MRLFNYLLVLVLLLVVAVPAGGQDVDLSETFTFETGATFSYPEGSDVEIDDEIPEFASVVVGDGNFINLLDFAYFEPAGFAAGDDLGDVLAWYVDFLFEGEVPFEEESVESIEEAVGREALSLHYFDDVGNAALMMVVRFGDGTFGVLDAYAEEVDFDGEDLALMIVTSFDRAAMDTAVAGGAPCTVSTGQANTVQLRVGPGTNRTVYAFLPADRDFTPLGKAAANDDSQWFQLDKDEVAPNSSAAEAWVAADSVDTTGDCDNIGESTAPPLIPIVPAAPTPDGTDGGDSGGGDTSGGDSGAIAPVAGTWTISYAATGKGSCLDNPGFTFDFPVGWTADVVQLSFSGSTLIMDGNRFAPIGGGVYSGVFTQPTGNSFELIIRPASATQFVGEARLTGVVEGGRTCSNTVPTTVTRN